MGLGEDASVLTAAPAATQKASAGPTALILIAAAPILFALATWSPEGVRYPVQASFRFLGLPVIAVEIAVILLAFRQRGAPLAALRAMPWPMKTALATLFVIAFVTAFFAPVAGISLTRTFLWPIHLLFGLTAARLIAAAPSDWERRLWPAIIAGTCFYLLMVALYVATIRSPATYDWLHFNLAGTHIRQAAFYPTVGAAAALALAAAERGRFAYGALVIAAAVQMAMFFWSGTRGSALAVLVAFAAGWAILPAMRSVRGLLGAALATLAGMALSLLHTVPSPYFGLIRISGSVTEATGANNLTSGRTGMWKGAWRTFLEHPLFGVGESQFRYIVPESGGAFNHPHNAFFQMLLQWGLVGAACFFGLIGLLLWQMVKAARVGGPDMAAAMTVAFALLVMASFEGTLYHSYPLMMLALCAAFVLARRASVKPG